jgi:Spy/CpxP family protein refolding chaperone
MKLNHTKIITLLAMGGMLALTPALTAQETNAPATPPAAGERAMHARGLQGQLKQLDLTPEQQPKVKAALEGMTQKIKDLRADTGLTPEDRRSKMKEIREQTNETMKTILTPEQYEKWLTIGPGAKHKHPAAAPTAPATPPASPQ